MESREDGRDPHEGTGPNAAGPAEPITEDETPQTTTVASVSAPKPAEATRRFLAIGALALIWVVTLTLMVLASLHWTDETLTLLLDRVFVPIMAFSGPAFGFYFAVSENRRGE
ncbi:hypothetical protein ACG83_30490 [Frankia sp. R43]|uniref:hypothetical protein n=1 Tax=Frankia sp. R43 TaxID=269536 RepID=UPI0006CA5479|nr:hypothetical protein [Frankia sp. R43]KPM51922.1 hypothetical protein ACG83_30490 [Frankia sp. R43]